MSMFSVLACETADIAGQSRKQANQGGLSSIAVVLSVHSTQYNVSMYVGSVFGPRVASASPAPVAPVASNILHSAAPSILPNHSNQCLQPPGSSGSSGSCGAAGPRCPCKPSCAPTLVPVCPLLVSIQDAPTPTIFMAPGPPCQQTLLRAFQKHPIWAASSLA